MDLVDLYEVTITLSEEVRLDDEPIVQRAATVTISPEGNLVLDGDAEFVSHSYAWESFTVKKLPAPKLN